MAHTRKWSDKDAVLNVDIRFRLCLPSLCVHVVRDEVSKLLIQVLQQLLHLARLISVNNRTSVWNSKYLSLFLKEIWLDYHNTMGGICSKNFTVVGFHTLVSSAIWTKPNFEVLPDWSFGQSLVCMAWKSQTVFLYWIFDSKCNISR